MRTLSIVTPVLNRATTISRALESASRLRQVTDWDVEHLIMDGGSTDGTLDEVARFEPEVSVFSEADAGLYEAINRGIERATGQYVWLLNSDDELLPSNGAMILERIEATGFPDAAWGGAEVAMSRADRSDSRTGHIAVLRGDIHGTLSVVSAMMGTPIINARILRRELYSDLGSFDPSIRIASDREFLIRLAMADIDATIFDDPIYRYHAHEGSLTIRDDRASPKTLHEYLDIADAYRHESSVPLNVRLAARAWYAWVQFLLETPPGARSVDELANWRRWKEASSRSALAAALLAKAWLQGGIRLRSILSTDVEHYHRTERI